MDESSLLAETDELLALLDTSAFGSETPRTNGSPVWLRAALSPAPAPEVQKKKKPRTEDPRLVRLQQLRSDAVKLEVELLLLRQQRHSALSVRDGRARVWQELASRQFRLRQIAEAENQHLKSLMSQVLRRPSSASIVLAEDGSLHSHFHGPPKKPILLEEQAADSRLASVFESLLRQLDIRYAEIDAVLGESGLNQAVTEQRTFAQKKSRRLGVPGQYVELADLRLSPFGWQSIGSTTWECNKAWHRKDGPFVYPCVDRPEDTFAVNYRVQSNAPGASGKQQQQLQSVDFKLVMRHYLEDERYVHVYASQSDGEGALAGVSSANVGYFACSSNESALAKPDSPSMSVLQSVMHTSPLSGTEDAAKVQSLLSVMTSAFEEDVRFVKQQVDGLLLQQARAGNDLFADEEQRNQPRLTP